MIQVEINCWFVCFNHTVDSTSNQAGVVDLRLNLGATVVSSSLQGSSDTSQCIPVCWKQAKLGPLYKRGPLLDPNNYRMLAVRGTMYRMYANVIRSLIMRVVCGNWSDP